MKNLIVCLLSLLTGITASAQLKTTPLCPEFTAHIMEGDISGIMANFTPGQIKTKFPCFTSEAGDSSKCGGLISYEDKGIYFYTDRDYIEINQKYKGKLSVPIMGAARSELFKWVGYPKIKDVSWDAFQTAYGLLILYYNKESKVNLIRMTTKSAETLKLCE